MAYLDDLDPSLDYDAQELALKQAEARIAALRGMKAPQLPGQTTGFQSAVTGTQVAGPVPKMKFGSYLGQAAPLLADYTAGRMQDEVLQRRTQLDAQQEADILRTIGEQPKGLGPTPALDAQGNPTSQMLSPVPPTLEANLKWGQKLSRFPKTRSLGGDYMKDQLIEQGKREQAQQLEMYKLLYGSQEKKLDRANALKVAETRAGKGANFHSLGNGQYAVPDPNQPSGWAVHGEKNKSPEDLNHNLQYVGVNPDSTGPHDAGFWADPRNPSKLIPGVRIDKPLPVGAGQAWMANNAAINQVDRAVEALRSSETATGFTKGVLASLGRVGNWAMNNWIDPDGTVTRAMVTDLGSLRLHDRSGATVTGPEWERLRSYIPEVGDSLKTAIDKLSVFRAGYVAMQKELLGYAENESYRLPGQIPTEPKGRTASGKVNQIPGGTPGNPAATVPTPAASAVRKKVWNKAKGDWE